MPRITQRSPVPNGSRGGLPAAVYKRQPPADQKQSTSPPTPSADPPSCPSFQLQRPAAASPRPRFRDALSCRRASALMQVHAARRRNPRPSHADCPGLRTSDQSQPDALFFMSKAAVQLAAFAALSSCIPSNIRRHQSALRPAPQYHHNYCATHRPRLPRNMTQPRRRQPRCWCFSVEAPCMGRRVQKHPYEHWFARMRLASTVKPGGRP